MSFWTDLIGTTPRPPPLPAVTPPAVKQKMFSTSGGTGQGLQGYSISHTGLIVNEYSALQSSAVYACVQTIVKAFANLPLEMMRKLPNGTWAVYDDHPAMAVVGEPNYWQTRFEFWSNYITWYCLRGNAYAYIVRDNSGKAIEFVPLQPNATTLNVGPDGQIFYAFTHPLTNNVITTGIDNMMHLKNPLSVDGLYGVSPIAVMQDTIGVALAAQKHAASIFKNGAFPSGIIKAGLEQEISEQTEANVINALQKVVSGSDNAHKFMLLKDGLEFEPLSISPVDAQLTEARQFSVAEIARGFGVPLAKINDPNNASYSNLQVMNQSFIDNCLIAICKPIEELLGARLLLPAERKLFKFRFDFDELLRGDAKTRAETQNIQLLNGTLSQDEARSQEGRGPVPGGAVPRVMMNTAQAGSPAAAGGNSTENGNDIVSATKPNEETE